MKTISIIAFVKKWESCDFLFERDGDTHLKYLPTSQTKKVSLKNWKCRILQYFTSRADEKEIQIKMLLIYGAGFCCSWPFARLRAFIRGNNFFIGFRRRLFFFDFENQSKYEKFLVYRSNMEAAQSTCDDDYRNKFLKVK